MPETTDLRDPGSSVRLEAMLEGAADKCMPGGTRLLRQEVNKIKHKTHVTRATADRAQAAVAHAPTL